MLFSDYNGSLLRQQPGAVILCMHDGTTARCTHACMHVANKAVEPLHLN